MPSPGKNIINGTIEKIGGDLNIGDNYYTHYWSKPNIQIESIEFPDLVKYPAPKFVDHVITQIKNRRLLIIGGNFSFDKNLFLKQVAFQLLGDLTKVKECTFFTDVYKLASSIEGKKEDWEVLLINNISPEDIEFKVQELLRATTRSNTYVVISTNRTYESWRFEDGFDQTHWFSVPDHDIYDSNVLSEYFQTSLQRDKIEHSFQVNLILNKLTTIDQIDSFIQMCHKEQKKIDLNLANELSQQVLHHQFDSILYWFHSLKIEQQLLVIGLSLLDGAHESQFFEIMDKILNSVWRNRNQKIELADYADLSPLLSFFSISGTVNSRYPNQKLQILKTAWKTHRRYIISAIPILTEIIIESVDGDFTNWRLFGKTSFRRKIQNVIAETFSDIGAFALSEIEGELIRLASYPHLGVQLVASRAMARWKHFGQEEILFGLIENWKSSAEVHNLAASNLGRKSSKESDAIAHIQSTLALTLGSVAQLEPQEKVSQRALDLFSRFTFINIPLVVNSMQFAIEILATRHLGQVAVNEVLRQALLRSNYFQESIGKGIANYYNHGNEIKAKATIEEWLRLVAQENQNRQKHDHLLFQDKLTIALIVALENIDYTATFNHSISIKYAYQVLENLRKTSHQKLVREYLLDAIVYLIEVNFEASEEVSIEFISNIDQHEREQLVVEFRDKYLRQRVAISGGEYRTTMGNYTFSTWESPELRPKTNVETLLNKWKKSKEDTLSQIALKSFLEFNRIEEEEMALIERYKKRAEDRQKELEKPLEEKQYDGKIAASYETEVFIKLAQKFIQPFQLPVLRNLATIILQENLSHSESKKLLGRLDDNPHDNDFTVVNNLYYVYSLFRNSEFEKLKSPLSHNINSMLFYLLGFFLVEDKGLLGALSPYLFRTETLKDSEAYYLIKRTGDKRLVLINFLYTVCRYPVYFGVALVVLYLVGKLM